MNDIANKKRRLKKVINEAKTILKKNFENIIEIRDERIHLCFIKGGKDIYFIRIVLDVITDLDKKIMEELPLPKTVIKEIWARHIGERSFYRVYWTGDKWVGTFPPILELEKEEDIKEKASKESIYFILSIERSAVKIGRSVNAKRRLSELRSQLFDELELLKVVESDNPVSLERSLHERFMAYHIKGEWFDYSNEIKRHVEDSNG